MRRCSARWPPIVPEPTKIPATCSALLQTSSKRDLEWFFDDWVYRDRGLPDFHVESVYARPLLSETQKSFLVTATIENRGHAGAEVPVLIQTPSGEKSVRVVVKAGEKGTGRIEVPVAPDQDHGQRWQRSGGEYRQQRLRCARAAETVDGCPCNFLGLKATTVFSARQRGRQITK